MGIKLFGHLVGTYQGGADWIQISKELGLIHVFDRLSLLRGEENQTEILNLINSQTVYLLIRVMLKKGSIFRHVTVSKLN